MSEPDERTFLEYYDILSRHLTTSGKIANISEQFSLLKNNADRVEFTFKLLEEYKLLPTGIILDQKDNGTASTLRQKGNDEFKLKRFDEALEFYTQSIGFAENGSESLALAYANRSAVLFGAGLYEECLTDIERAIEGCYPDHLKPKLYARKQNCLNMIEKSRKVSHYQPIPQIMEEGQNARIQCGTNAIELASNPLEGRHIVAARDIEVGEILVVEKPFCHIILREFTTHCHECLELCYSLIPCGMCSETFYCSQRCQTLAHPYHRYECGLLKTFRKLQVDELKLLPFKIAICVKDLYEEINHIENNVEVEYRSDRYDEIHHLEDNTHSRPVFDLFWRSLYAAILYHYLKTFTGFFESSSSERTFKELILKHMQTAPSNFHQISEMTKTDGQLLDATELGAGAYSFSSMFNHNCSPNVIRTFHGSSIVIRSLKSIKKGEQCYDNYGYLFPTMPRNERQKLIKKQYHFECMCKPCEEDWPLFAELPQKSEIPILDVDFEKLSKGNISYAMKIEPEVKDLLSRLEQYEPDTAYASAQEIWKRCIALYGNVRRPL